MGRKIVYNTVHHILMGGEMKRSSLDDGVYDALLAKIVLRELRPGERIVEAELAEELGVSRTPVRAALRTLIAQGLVQKRPNRGCIVAKHDLEDIFHMYELREALEGMAARLMARHANEAEVTLLRNLAFAQRDVEFHRAVLAGCGNPFINEVANADTIILKTFLDYPTPVGQPWVFKYSHDDIVTAIEAGDPDAAEAAMRRHIREPKERLEQWLQSARLHKGGDESLEIAGAQATLSTIGGSKLL